MRIAFYAPMKPPDHPAPSGDRRMARLLMAALDAGGHSVELSSRFRSYDGAGAAERQRPPGGAWAPTGGASDPSLPVAARRPTAPGMVYLSSLPQSARLVGSLGRRQSRHPLCGDRGVPCAETAARALGVRMVSGGARPYPVPIWYWASTRRMRTASRRCSASGRGSFPCGRFSTPPLTPPPPSAATAFAGRCRGAWPSTALNPGCFAWR